MSAARPRPRVPERRRPLVLEVSASALAVVVSTDAALGYRVSPILWGLLLIVGAMTVAALRRRGRRADEEHTLIAYHPALGLLVMALLQFASVPEAAGAPVVETRPGPHGHAGSSMVGAFGLIGPLAGVGFAVLTVFALSFARTRAERAMLAILGATVTIAAGISVGR